MITDPPAPSRTSASEAQRPMTILLFKLFTTPTLILVATLVSRRFGQATGGWLVGLPLTSGPIAVFLAIEQGPRFAQLAADGSLQGTAAQAAFAAAYACLARDRPWTKCLLGASLSFVASGFLLRFLGLPTIALVVVACAALAAAAWTIGSPAAEAGPAEAPKWDLPLRMIVATALVLSITSIATVLGPTLSGLAATFPVFAAVLSVFAHRHEGAPAAQGVLRGLVLGLFGFVGFFTTVSLLVTRITLPSVFAAALVVDVLISVAAYPVVRRR